MLEEVVITVDMCLAEVGHKRSYMRDVLWNLEFAFQFQGLYDNEASDEFTYTNAIFSHIVNPKG